MLFIYVLYILFLGLINGNEILYKIGVRIKGKWIFSIGGIYLFLKRLEIDEFIEG